MNITSAINFLKNNKSTISVVLLIVSVGFNVFTIFHSPSTSTTNEEKQIQLLQEVKNYVIDQRQHYLQSIELQNQIRAKLEVLDENLGKVDAVNEKRKTETRKKYDKISHIDSLSTDSLARAITNF